MTQKRGKGSKPPHTVSKTFMLQKRFSPICFQQMVPPLCHLQPRRRSRRKRRMQCQRSPQAGRPFPDHGPCRSGQNPMPGPCCEDATRATPWATTPERGRRRTSTWCCHQRWGWAAPCWTWTQRARNGTALCHCAAFRVLQHDPPSLSWKKSSSHEQSSKVNRCSPIRSSTRSRVF